MTGLGVEINKQIFVFVYRSIFIRFTIYISYFQVVLFSVFFACSGFLQLLYFQGLLFFYFNEFSSFFLIFSFLPISLYIFRFSTYSTFSIFLYFLYFYAFQVFYIASFPYLFLQVFCIEIFLSNGLYCGADEYVQKQSVKQSLYGEEIHSTLSEFLESKTISRIPLCT